ncbi:MAG: VCBS repeat-containing protein [Thermomicrobiales bacterium]
MRGITVAICTLVGLSMLPAIHLEYSATAQSAGDTICSAENGDACYNTSAGPIFTLPQWADVNRWSEASYYSTIQLADIDGDGADELLARGPDGISVQKWDAANGHAVWNQITGSGPLSDSDGWDRPEYYATIQTADIDGDGSAELLGRGKDGLYTYKWNGTGWDLLKSDDPSWTNDAGWDKPEYYETIQTADIDGDHAAELLARDADGLNTYRWNGSGWDQIGTERPAWSDAYGWNAPQYYQTIQAGDIDGDGAEEILARGTAGIESYDWGGGA